MQLHDMKFTPEEKKRETATVPASSDDRPDYPWGATLNLSDDMLKKLLPSLKDLEGGERVRIAAVGKVTEIRLVQKEGSREVEHVAILMQKIGVESAPDNDFEDGFADSTEA